MSLLRDTELRDARVCAAIALSDLSHYKRRCEWLEARVVELELTLANLESGLQKGAPKNG
jgi:hypothetical protein